MPYEPDQRARQNARRRAGIKRRNQARESIVAVAAILSLLVAIFNLYVSWPLGIPPEFALFMILFVIFTALWWTIRKNIDSQRPKT